MPRINKDRVLSDLRKLASFGAYKTGVHRPTLSVEDVAAREWFVHRLREVREPLRPPPRVCATTAPKLAPAGQFGRWRRLVLQHGTKVPAGLRPVHLVIFHR